MKYVTSKERQQEGIKQLVPVYYKEQFKEGIFNQVIKIYLMCFALIAALMLFMKEERKFFLYILYFLLTMSVLVSIIIFIGYNKSKKQKIADNILNIEHFFDDKYTIVTNYKDGNFEKIEYAYTDINKINEDKEFFFLFMKKNTIILLDKISIEDMDEFKKFIKDKNILLKEMKKNEDK